MPPFARDLMDEIDWNDRLIGIKGTRGVGKTTFLLQYAKEKFNRPLLLFINMNNFTSPVTAWWTSLTNSSAAAERYC